MELMVHIPADQVFVDAAIAVLTSTRDIVGTEAEAFGRVEDGRNVVLLRVPDDADREAVVRAIRAATGLEARGAPNRP